MCEERNTIRITFTEFDLSGMECFIVENGIEGWAGGGRLKSIR